MDENISKKTWIVGPCALESEDSYNQIAEQLIPIMQGKDWYYKASFDKANRSSVHGARGVGLDEGVQIFKNFKKSHPEILLLTDVHEVGQVEKLAGVIDCIQIPAFLCRQTDLLTESGRHFDKVEIKKGQWMNPRNIAHSADKVRKYNSAAQVWLADRGTFFGYERLFVDFGAVDLFKRYFDKVFLDTTHSTQFIDSQGFNKGDRALAERYLVGSTIFGYDGIFAETHPAPETSITDGTSMLKLSDLSRIVKVHDRVEALLRNEVSVPCRPGPTAGI